MKKIIAILILAIFSIVSVPDISFAATRGKTHVKSYKRNGKRVKGHSKHVYRGHSSLHHKRKR